MSGLGYILVFAWYVVVIIQSFLAYGTAYRYTKQNGDDGVSLFGWVLLMQLAATIPGLGIYLWKKIKNIKKCFCNEKISILKFS